MDLRLMQRRALATVPIIGGSLVAPLYVHERVNLRCNRVKGPSCEA